MCFKSTVSQTELITWNRVLSEKLKGPQLAKKFYTSCGTWIFITAVASGCHLSLSSSKGSAEVRALVKCFVRSYVFTVRIFKHPRPTPRPEGRPIFGYQLLLIQYIHSYPLLHRQPKDAPCCGDRDLLTTNTYGNGNRVETSAVLI